MTHRYHRTKGDPVEPTIKEMCLNNNILYLGKGDEDENDKTLYQFQCSCGFSWEDVAEVFFNMILKKENFDESYTPCPSCNEYRRKAIDPELLDEDYEESDDEESDDEQSDDEQSDDEQSNDEKSDQEESGMDFCQPVVEIINLDSDSDSDSDPLGKHPLGVCFLPNTENDSHRESPDLWNNLQTKKSKKIMI